MSARNGAGGGAGVIGQPAPQRVSQAAVGGRLLASLAEQFAGEPVQVVVLLVTPARPGLVDRQQPAGGQLAEDPHHPHRRDPVPGYHLPGQWQADRPVEHGHPAEHDGLVRVEQQVAAAGDRAQAARLAQHLRQVIEQVARGHDRQLGRDQLQGERQAAAPTAQR